MAKSTAVRSTAEPAVDLVVVTPTPADLLVEEWFLETFHGLPELGVDLFNRFRLATDSLKSRLSGRE